MIAASGLRRPANERSRQCQVAAERRRCSMRARMSAARPRVEEDVALAHARLLGQQASVQQRLADGLGQRAVVAREAAGEVA